MSQHKRRLVDRIVDGDFLDDLQGMSLDDLRRLRDDCREAENEVSFERRLAHARIDILSAELDRRTGAGEGELLQRLPEILAAETSVAETPLPARAPTFTVPRNVDVPRRRVEEIVGEQTLTRLPQVSTEEVRAIIGSLDQHERRLSQVRSRIHEVTDRVQAEIVRRYTSGEADPAAALP